MAATVPTFATKSNTNASVDPTKEVRAEDMNELKAVAVDHAALIDLNTAHRGLTNNPHTVTKAQIGLANCDNTSDANKPVSSATQTALDLKSNTNHTHVGVYEPADADLQAHLLLTDNPHAVTKDQVGLGSVPNIDCTIAANIVQNSTRRFVSDDEKAVWNSTTSGNISAGTPVNAVAAGCALTVVSRPDDYVSWKYGSFDLTVASQPLTNVQSTGTIVVNGVPTLGNTFTVYDQLFTYVAAYTLPARVAGEVLVAVSNDDNATNIAFAINTDLATTEAVAVANANTVTVTAGSNVIYRGTGGDVVVFAETDAEANTAFTPGTGTLGGGVNADTLGLSTETYTFIPHGSTPGVGEIALGATALNTANNIVARVTAVGNPLFTIANVDADITVTAVTRGLAGNGIPYSTDGTRITNDGAPFETAGGVDEVRSYLTIAGKNYTFASTVGEDPTDEYVTDVKVATAGAASMDDIAAALVVALELDTTNFSAASVSSTGAVVTLKAKTKGTSGNAITYVNHLLVAGDITATGITSGLFTGGIDGTIATAYQLMSDASYLYYAVAVNTVADTNWRRISLGSAF